MDVSTIPNAKYSIRDSIDSISISIYNNYIELGNGSRLDDQTVVVAISVNHGQAHFCKYCHLSFESFGRVIKRCSLGWNHRINGSKEYSKRKLAIINQIRLAVSLRGHPI